MKTRQKTEEETKEVSKVVLSVIQEEYLDIYHKYFVLRWDWSEIAKYHKCNQAKIQRAVKWVIDNKLTFPSKSLLKGAIDAVSSRLKSNRVLYNAETLKKRYRDNTFIIALSREIREDEKMLGQLESVYSETDGGEKQSLSAGQVLALIAAAKQDK